MMRYLWLTKVTLGFPQSLLIPTITVFVMAWLWVLTPAINWINGLALLVAGLAAWTLLEYLLHRFMLHGVEPLKVWHLQHHLHPDVPMRTPLAFSLTLLLAVVILPTLVRDEIGFAVPFSCGLIVGHLLQEVVHHQLHKSTSSSRAWLKTRCHHHHVHHHGYERANYGTLTGFWDSLFNTHAGR